MKYRLLVLCLLGFISQPLWADKTPHQRIEAVTVSLLQVIDEGKDYFDEEPERFYQQIDELIDPLIDFPSFTRSVMGEFGTRTYYSSLNAEQKQQFKQDYKRFVVVFKKSLIETYAKGLLAFSSDKITVLAPAAEDEKAIAQGAMVSVMQKVQGKGKVYLVNYKMRPNKAGDWLVRNVTIDSVNIGQLYQNQFLAAMKKQDNNFTAVIDHWAIEKADLQGSQGEK